MPSIDVTTMSWYDPAATPEENYENGVVYYATKFPNIQDQPDTGPDSEAEALSCYSQLRVMGAQRKAIEDTFSAFVNDSFSALAAEYDAARVALGKEMSARKKAGYDMTPEFVAPADEEGSIMPGMDI